MAFWSSQKLKKNIHKLILLPNYKDRSDIDRLERLIDCNAITLSVGPEIFLSSEKETGKVKCRRENDGITEIAPGQFAYIITDEYIHVPKDTMAFISFKAKYKFKGLINVSGFHVDPGWNGRLVFSLYNAGSNTISIKRGDPFFLIWYADLDASSEDNKAKASWQHHIKSGLLDNINQNIPSPSALDKRINDLEKTFHAELTAASARRTIGMIGLIIGVIAFALRYLPELLTFAINMQINGNI